MAIPLSFLVGRSPTPLTHDSYMAAGTFTPRNEHVVTQHELWYRYMPESSNWHDGIFTRWITAFSAATRKPAPLVNTLSYPHTTILIDKKISRDVRKNSFL